MGAASPVHLYAFGNLRSKYMYMLLRESCIRVLTYPLKEDMFITLLTENDKKYYFDQMGFQLFIKNKMTLLSLPTQNQARKPHSSGGK